MRATDQLAGHFAGGLPVFEGHLTSDDGGAPAADALVAGIRSKGGKGVKSVHAATDHSWSDARVRLASEVIAWLRGLP